MKKIPLTQGKFALVDDEDFEYLSQWKWFYKPDRKNGYAARSDNKAKKTIRMHVVINNTPKGFETDHRDGDGLNNQRYNLRTTLRKQNLYNKSKYKNGDSLYKGVGFVNGKYWRARIRKDKTLVYLGQYIEQKEAAIAYDIAAREFFGEYARLNFPEIPLDLAKEMLKDKRITMRKK